MRKKLVVIEGLDGSGKQTQVSELIKNLKKENKKAKHISFPDYNEPSSALVKMYLSSEFGANPSDVNAYAASSFYAVDRYASYKKFWEKNYLSGEIIICDRYTTSNAIYQMPKLPKKDWESYLTWLYDYEYNKLELPKPDLVIYLNMPIEISQNLMEKRYEGDQNKKDLHEKNIKFLKNCQEAANYIKEKDKWITINCLENNSIKSISQIQNEILSFLKKDGI